MEDTKKIKIPLGFMLCSFTETFERLAYYLSRSILLIFITTSVAQGGLALDDTVGANMQSNLTAFAYGAAIIGGIIVDRWIGARWTTPVGMLVAGAGYYVGSVATGVGSLYLMIILVSFGLGLFRNAPILGRIITDKKVMDSAFSIRYTLVNLGATLGPVIGGVLYKDTFAKNGVLGFAPCFRISAAIMVLGAVYYVLVCWRHIGDVGRVPFDKTKTQEEIEEEKKNKAVRADGAKQPLTTLEKNRIIAIIIVCLLQILYWIFSFLAFLPLYYYWAGKMDWTIGGWEMPVTWAESFNGIWCMIPRTGFRRHLGKAGEQASGRHKHVQEDRTRHRHPGTVISLLHHSGRFQLQESYQRTVAHHLGIPHDHRRDDLLAAGAFLHQQVLSEQIPRSDDRLLQPGHIRRRKALRTYIWRAVRRQHWIPHGMRICDRHLPCGRCHHRHDGQEGRQPGGQERLAAAKRMKRHLQTKEVLYGIQAE